MPIVFDQVSYSYDEKRETARKRGIVARLRAGKRSSDQGEEPRDQPAWGSTAQQEWALRDVSFTLGDGEFLGLCGHTGSGKSTLIQHMNGLLTPTDGRVIANGADLSDKKAAQRCRADIGVVFQYPEHQLFAETVLADVSFGPRNLGLSEEEAAERSFEALRAVELDADAVADKSPFELSGGQQRRVALAGVIAMRPSVLVLDEPAAGLDPQARDEMLNLVARLHREGMAILMASHNMDDLARFSDRILVLNQGSVFMLGTPDEVFSRGDELRSIGLDAPFAQTMAEALRTRGVALNQGLYDIEGLAAALAERYRARCHGQAAEPQAQVRDAGEDRSDGAAHA